MQDRFHIIITVMMIYFRASKSLSVVRLNYKYLNKQQTQEQEKTQF